MKKVKTATWNIITEMVLCAGDWVLLNEFRGCITN
jgi:hypothetical protein